MPHRNRARSALLLTLALTGVGCGAAAGNGDASGPSGDRTQVAVSDGAAGTSDDGGVADDDAGTRGDDGGTNPGDDAAVDAAPDGSPPPVDALPDFDAATAQHVRDLVARGQAAGNRRDVFAKIGDSITESASFLYDCGYGWYSLGSYGSLQATIQLFSARLVDSERNSFNRASVSAVAGWTSDQALMNDGAQPLIAELDSLHPQWAFIMYGTNDIDRSNVTAFVANMNAILDVTEARGVVPVLYTIPPRTDDTQKTSLSATFAEAVRGLARDRHLPLIDYNAALAVIPAQGISPDGIHPNLYTDSATDSGDSCVFTDPALQFGYNVRNLLTLQMLARLSAY